MRCKQKKIDNLARVEILVSLKKWLGRSVEAGRMGGIAEP
jgi:hypothetical protein